MTEILYGAPVADSLNEKITSDVLRLKQMEIVPTLAILRVGKKTNDKSYEKSIIKHCALAGVEVKSIVMSIECSQDEIMTVLENLNNDNRIHGILIFRPLPKHLDDEAVRRAMNPQKDVDGITDGSLAGIFTNENIGFAPCTAQAALEILDYYGYECKGKHAVIIGRSLVVGRPVAMMLLHKNATVTICHTKTNNIETIAKQAEILIVCVGKNEVIDGKYFNKNQIVVDVGINWNKEEKKICGDVNFNEAIKITHAITPVPRGVGIVTTSVLISHVIESAKRGGL